MSKVLVDIHIGFEARSEEALVIEEIGAIFRMIAGRKRPGDQIGAGRIDILSDDNDLRDRMSDVCVLLPKHLGDLLDEVIGALSEQNSKYLERP